MRAALFALTLLAGSAFAHPGHHHPPQHAAMHETFYKDWMRPDNRTLSCCNLKDCEPVEVRKANGFWEILRPADGKWLRVPWSQVENERDSPDGRNHGCFQPPGLSDTVFCLVIGSGG